MYFVDFVYLAICFNLAARDSEIKCVILVCWLFDHVLSILRVRKSQGTEYYTYLYIRELL